MKKIALAVALLASISICPAQSDAKDKKAVEAQVSDSLQLKIVKLQNDQLQLQSQANQYQQALTGLSNQFAADGKQLGELEDQAFAEAKLSKEDYSIDPKTFKFTAKPKPASKESK